MGGLFSKSRQCRIPSDLHDYCPYDESIESNLSKAPARIRNPLIYKRWSSMYIDEDGDIAHEFIAESCQSGDRKSKFVKRTIFGHQLVPQGLVDYDIPRLHPDIPFIVMEVSSLPSCWIN